MIGCERLCGRCGGCQKVVMALDAHASGQQVGRWNRTEFDTLLDPSSLADLLARALRGRGLVFPGAEDPDNCWIDAMEARIGNPFDGVLIHPRVLTMPQARATLARLLALPLDCGADAAIAALEE